jgi:hypothetical protein
MKRIIPVLIALSLLLSSCNIFGGNTVETPMSDAQMATRVAELLSTMTTPTTEIVFPPTPTPGLPTVMFPTVASTDATSTPIVVVTEIVTATPGTSTLEVTATPALTETEAVTETPEPTATATLSSSDPANNLGTPTGSDSMDSYTNWSWPTGEDEYLKVRFNNGKMEMSGLSKYAGWRMPLLSQQVNTYIELTADSGTCKGKDSYGIIFRVPVLIDPVQGYLYEVTCDGYYRLWKWDQKVPPNGLATVLVPWSQSSLINTGANQTNRLGVMVDDDMYTLYMNGVKLASASDSAYDAGFFGLFVRSVETTDYTVKFDSARYWSNP